MIRVHVLQVSARRRKEMAPLRLYVAAGHPRLGRCAGYSPRIDPRPGPDRE
jgi:hypothetical protein